MFIQIIVMIEPAVVEVLETTEVKFPTDFADLRRFVSGLNLFKHFIVFTH